MKAIFYFLLFFSLSFQISSQNQVIEGIVTYQNTGAPLQGVRVYDANPEIDANQYFTRSNGLYRLEFVEKKSGDAVRIGAELEKLRIVNQKEVDLFTLPSKVGEFERFRIVMCNASEYNRTLADYNSIFLGEFTKNFEKRISKLELSVQEITSERNQIKIKAEQLAESFAIIDLSQAFEFEKEAVKWLKIDNVEKAISVYQANLKPTYLKLEKHEEETKKAIRHLSASYTIQANLYSSQFQTRQAVEAFDTVILIQKKYGHYFQPNELAETYINAANLNRNLPDYQMTRAYLKSALIYLDGTECNLEGAVYNNLSILFLDLGKTDSALIYQKLSMGKRKKCSKASGIEFAINCNFLSLIYHQAMVLDSALFYQKLTISILDSLKKIQSELLPNSYNNLAFIFQDLEKLDSALFYIESAIIKAEKISETKVGKPLLATCYHNKAGFLLDLGILDSALIYQKLSIQLREQIYVPNHPYFAYSYNNLGLIYYNKVELDSALNYQIQCVNIREKAYRDPHPSLVISYHNLARTYYKLADLDSTIFYEKKALDMLISYFPNDTNLGLVTNLLAEALFRKGEECYDGASHCLDRSCFSNCISYYSNSIELTPYQPSPYIKRALSYFYLNEFNKAIADFDSYSKLEENLPNVYYTFKGMAAAKSNDFAAAEKLFKTFERLNVNNPDVYQNWGLYFALQNKPTEAVKNLEKAVELGYNNCTWLKYEESLLYLQNEKRFQDILEMCKNNK